MSKVWEHVTLKGFKVFKWNEKLQHNNVAENEGLLVLRRSPDHLIRRVVTFDLDTLVDHPSDHEGYFLPRLDSPTFDWSLAKAHCFEPDVAHDLSDEIYLFLIACFRFDAVTLNCPLSPRLVFVVDLSYTEVRRPRYYQLKVPTTHWIRVAAHEIEYSDDDDEDEDDDDDDDDDECTSEEDETTDESEEMESDVEDGYSEEMKDIVGELRRFCGNVERTYPLEPLRKEEPLGLVEAAKMLEIVVVEVAAVPPFPCAICLECFAAEQVAMKTKCGHLFHKECSISWFSSEFTCPMCRSNTRCIV